MIQWVLLLVSTLHAWELSQKCPPFFRMEDGRCYYNIAYLEDLPDNGLKKPFPVFANGFRPKVIDLGRILFFDPLLSHDSTFSCAHCHKPALGFSDGRDRAVGISGVSLGRSSPALWNAGFSARFFWDARSHSLEDQARGPLFAKDEMGTTPKELESKLNSNATYRKLFASAFEEDFRNRITTDLVVEALATFERTLVSMNSRYDRYVYGDGAALNFLEQKGLTLFRSFLTRCTECHTPPLFMNYETANIGAPDFEGKTGDFKIPSLRNIARSAPYMHAGGLKTLKDVVHFYSEGGGRGPLGLLSTHLHWHMTPFKILSKDEDAIVAFLNTLTDESAMPKVPNSLPSGLQPISGGSDAF